MLRGLRSGFGKVAVISSFALILVIFALPAFALAGDQPATVDSAVATQPPDDPQDDTQNSPSPAVAPAPPSDMMHRNYMFNWGTERQKWADKGFSFNFFYITDAFYDFHRPTAETRDVYNNWNRIRGTVDLDFGKMSDAKGLSFHVTGLWQNGSNMGAIIGSISNPSGLVSFHQFRLDSMWMQQKLVKDKIVLTAGLIASRDFYGLQEYGGSFLIEPLDYAFGNLGNVRASFDPSTGPGAEVKIIPEKHFYVKTAYIMPSSLDLNAAGEDVYPTGFNYRNGAFGSTSNTEVGFYSDPDAPTTRKSYPGIIKAGYIYNGGRDFYDYSANRFVSGNYTVYLQANQPVFRTAAGSNRGIDVTVGFNIGPQNKSQVPSEYTAGLIFNGPIPGRAKDGLNFGFVYSKISSDYNRDVVAGALPTVPPTPPAPELSDEKAYEVNYKAMVFPWLVFQPTFQYYQNVGGRPHGDAGLIGFRFVSTF
jgi:carbohydrate-selective porin OprB